jgi:hypothetical protein
MVVPCAKEGDLGGDEGGPVEERVRRVGEEGAFSGEEGEEKAGAQNEVETEGREREPKIDFISTRFIRLLGLLGYSGY